MGIELVYIIAGILFLFGGTAVFIFFITRKKNAGENIRPSHDVQKLPAANAPGGQTLLHNMISWFRFSVGLTALLLLCGLFSNTADSISYAAEKDASAVQIIQIYSEALFYALIITGGALSLYILSRVSFKSPRL